MNGQALNSGIVPLLPRTLSRDRAQVTLADETLKSACYNLCVCGGGGLPPPSLTAFKSIKYYEHYLPRAVSEAFLSSVYNSFFFFQSVAEFI